MREELIRFAIGVAFGAIIGALAVWQWAHDDADKVLRDWEVAATTQQAAERKRTDRITEELRNGHAVAVAELRRRLVAGWRPTIHAASELPAGNLPKPASGVDEGTADPVPGADGLAACEAERVRLIGDGAETTLQLISLQAWVAGVSRLR